VVGVSSFANFLPKYKNTAAVAKESMAGTQGVGLLALSFL